MKMDTGSGFVLELLAHGNSSLGPDNADIALLVAKNETHKVAHNAEYSC